MKLFLLIIALVLASSLNPGVSFGINGISETRCLNGYLFIVSEGGQARQVLDEFGKGAKCERVGQ